MSEYLTIKDNAEAEIVEKKSRFIAHISYVENEDEALEFVEKIKKQYWDARHNCFAYRIWRDKNPVSERCSDDGEPSMTAGMPMLEVLKGAQVLNVVAVVTRYFGGTLLGTGGLVRAYSKAVKEGLENAGTATKKLLTEIAVETDYVYSPKIQYEINSKGYQISNSIYTDSVKLMVLLEDNQIEGFTKRINDITNGSALIYENDKLWAKI